MTSDLGFPSGPSRCPHDYSIFHQRKRTACSSNARSANKAVARITTEQRIENARFFRGPILFFLAPAVRAPFEFIINMDNIVNKGEFTNLFAQFFGAPFARHDFKLAPGLSRFFRSGESPDSRSRSSQISKQLMRRPMSLGSVRGLYLWKCRSHFVKYAGLDLTK
jgi:hypothetical protein